MRPLLVLVAVGLLAGCQIIYKLPTRQGNVIEQKHVDQLKIGMSHEQVLYLMGTPLASSPFRRDRWDYVGYYKSPRGHVSKRVVTLYFEGDKLARMEGEQETVAASAIENPDLKTVVREGKKDKQEAERAAGKETRPTGLVITPE